MAILERGRAIERDTHGRTRLAVRRNDAMAKSKLEVDIEGGRTLRARSVCSSRRATDEGGEN